MTQSVLVDEEWRPIEKYHGYYEVSNLGRVRSLKVRRNVFVGNNKTEVRYINRIHILNATDNGRGYLLISIRDNGHKKNFYVHRLVAEAFIPNPMGYSVVNHKDCNSHNNCAENLEWCTQEYNVNYSKDKMRGLRNASYSSTGERYITKKGDKFRLCNRSLGIDKCFNTIEEAINAREELLNGKIGIS